MTRVRLSCTRVKPAPDVRREETGFLERVGMDPLREPSRNFRHAGTKRLGRRWVLVSGKRELIRRVSP